MSATAANASSVSASITSSIGEQPGRVPTALVVRPVRGDPVGDDARLLLVERRVCRAVLQVLFLAGAEVGAEAPIRFARHIARGPDVGRGVEHHAPGGRGHEAALRRRDGMHHGALRRIAEERVGEPRRAGRDLRRGDGP